VAGHALHPGKIGTGREAFALPRHDNDASCRIRSQRVDRLRHLGDQSVVEGVMEIGPVKPERGNGAVLLDEDVAHDYMRNTPKRVSSIGALRAANRPSPNTRRLSAGAMMPSSHNLALA